MSLSRRTFLRSAALTTLGSAFIPRQAAAGANAAACAFRMAVITDEISQDFEEACQLASTQMGLGWVEIRSLWNKNVSLLDAKEVLDVKRVLAKYQLRITDLGSPLFKVPWPEAATGVGDLGKLDRGSFGNGFNFAEQDELLDRCLALCSELSVDRIRCFDFLTLKDPRPHRAAINEKLRQAAERCAKHKVFLVLENEESCNTQTAAQAAEVLHAVPHSNLLLNWDPANDAAVGGDPFPHGWSLLPKNRIGHVHCKDVIRKDGQYVWAPVGEGVVDWVGQFRALAAIGYSLGVSLETHWHGPGSKEESTRKSMDGVKTALRKAEIACPRVLNN